MVVRYFGAQNKFVHLGICKSKDAYCEFYTAINSKQTGRWAFPRNCWDLFMHVRLGWIDIQIYGCKCVITQISTHKQAERGINMHKVCAAMSACCLHIYANIIYIIYVHIYLTIFTHSRTHTWPSIWWMPKLLTNTSAMVLSAIITTNTTSSKTILAAIIISIVQRSLWLFKTQLGDYICITMQYDMIYATDDVFCTPGFFTGYPGPMWSLNKGGGLLLIC